MFLGMSGTGEKAAVKPPHTQVAQDPDTRRRFHRELASLQRVAPFCTARVLAADPDADPPYIVSEYVTALPCRTSWSRRGAHGRRSLERLAIAHG